MIKAGIVDSMVFGYLFMVAEWWLLEGVPSLGRFCLISLRVCVA